MSALRASTPITDGPSEAPVEVTVVIPTRNRSRLVIEAIASVLGQVGVSLELIVINDGSSDDTAEALARLGDPRLRILHHERSCGVAASRNRGLELARGEWVAFLDDDDLWAPGWLDTALAAARPAGAVMAYGGRFLIDSERRVVGASAACDDHALAVLLRRYNAIGGPSTVVLKTESMRAAGGFAPRMSAFADWEAWLRMLEQGGAVAVTDLLIAYTLHEGNMHMTDPSGYLAEFARFRALVSQRTGGAVEIEAETFLRWLSGEALRSPRRGVRARLWWATARASGQATDMARAVAALLRGPAPQLVPTCAAPAWLRALRDVEDPAPAEA